MVLLMGLSVQWIMDLVVAGISFSDWFEYFRFYCFHSLFCCFHLQRQACLLIRLSTIQWCFCFLIKRCGYNVDDVFFSEAAALRLL
uniref:Uncharacterized protein n=1 Tax=Salix viminalis TaxID=40686 RepID=A0A6N2M391_SALVM